MPNPKFEIYCDECGRAVGPEYAPMEGRPWYFVILCSRCAVQPTTEASEAEEERQESQVTKVL